MATFQYIAKDASGNETRGTIEAGDRSGAIAAVRAQGLFPTALGEVKGAAAPAAAPKVKKGKAPAAAKPAKSAAKKEIKIKLPSFGRIKTKVLTQFTRQLATLVTAGLPLMRGIEVLKRQMKDPRMKDALEGIADNIS